MLIVIAFNENRNCVFDIIYFMRYKIYFEVFILILRINIKTHRLNLICHINLEINS